VRFYVYRIFDAEGKTLYIGKGTGRRLQNQIRRFKADGEVLERFRSEKASYRKEIELISEHKPPLNKHAGGNGSRCEKQRDAKTKLDREIEAIGLRVYTARALLMKGEKALLNYISKSNLDTLRQVAYGKGI